MTSELRRVWILIFSYILTQQFLLCSVISSSLEFEREASWTSAILILDKSSANFDFSVCISTIISMAILAPPFAAFLGSFRHFLLACNVMSIIRIPKGKFEGYNQHKIYTKPTKKIKTYHLKYLPWCCLPLGVLNKYDLQKHYSHPWVLHVSFADKPEAGRLEILASSAVIRLSLPIRTCFITCLKEGFVGGIDTPPNAFLARDLVIRTKFSWTSEVETFSLFALGCIEEEQYII